MRLLLVGYPLEHSQSPIFQNAALQACGLTHRYELNPLESFTVSGVRKLLLQEDVLGANITVPYKERMVLCVDNLTTIASRVGAINTVYYREKASSRRELIGDNTDVPALMAELATIGELAVSGGEAIVLGAGGAARAALAALLELGYDLSLVNRTVSRAEQLAEELGKVYSSSISVYGLQSYAETSSSASTNPPFASAALVIDATSAGLGLEISTPEYEQVKRQLLSLPFELVPSDAVFYDLKYGPSSPFCEIGRELGVRTVNGLGMLVRQGALAFERWTGLPAPLGVMRAAVGLPIC